ncbi:hypothetical protein E1B28_000425 [Marasmius oreades]|uniref:Uncharacterized protein n=1 Tax=Marasmius oreades TaxID=181124 RepID=A0A9P7V1G8_9AGAR|nr:uncharacterized protein E1B28_000425 [Marasmius oreades]KAG7098480.1 hypothetical protein E1B28_000425 [Marasmius oreades]
MNNPELQTEVGKPTWATDTGALDSDSVPTPHSRHPVVKRMLALIVLGLSLAASFALFVPRQITTMSHVLGAIYLLLILLGAISPKVSFNGLCLPVLLAWSVGANLLVLIWTIGSPGYGVLALGRMIPPLPLTGVNLLSAIYLVEGEIPLHKMGMFGAIVNHLRSFIIRKLCKKTDKEEEKTVMV